MSDYEAGRELDALIAEKVFGWADAGERQMWSIGDNGEAEPDGTSWMGQPPEDQRRAPTSYEYIPRYSLDIAAAWRVVEKLAHDGWKLQIDLRAGLVCVSTLSLNGDDREDYRFGAGHSGPSALHEIPHCICRAALEAIGKPASNTPNGASV